MKADARGSAPEIVGKVPVHILLDKEDVNAVEQLAAETGETKSGLIRRLIRGYIKARAAKQTLVR